MELEVVNTLMDFARRQGLGETVDSYWIRGDLLAEAYDFAAYAILWDLKEAGVVVPGDLLDDVATTFPDEDDIHELIDSMSTRLVAS